MPKSDFIRFLSLTFCTSNFKILCEDLLFLVAGADASQLNVVRELSNNINFAMHCGNTN